MLGENIKSARKNKGITQEELAIRLNVVRQTVSKWEKNLSVPDADLLEKLAANLDTDVHVLLGCEPPKQDENSKASINWSFIAEQLSRINEREAVKMRNTRKILTVIGIAIISLIIIGIIWYAFGRTVTVNENTTEVLRLDVNLTEL